jgi:hypothetical protein
MKELQYNETNCTQFMSKVHTENKKNGMKMFEKIETSFSVDLYGFEMLMVRRVQFSRKVASPSYEQHALFDIKFEITTTGRPYYDVHSGLIYRECQKLTG